MASQRHMFSDLRPALAAGVSLVALAASAAHAAEITNTYNLTATDPYLISGDGSVSPIDPVTLDFSVTFDPSVTIDPTTVGLHVISTNVPDPLELAYYGGRLVIATAPDAVGSCVINANTFCAYINDPVSSPSYDGAYQGTSTGGYWWDVDGSVTLVSSVSGPAPEPAAWSLMLIGIAAIGLLLRAGRHQAKPGISMPTRRL